MEKKNSSDKNKELVLRAILSIILFIVLIISIVLLVLLKKQTNVEPSLKTEIPEIKEEYSATKLNIYKEYNNIVLYNEQTKEIELGSDDENIDYYTIGTFGKIYSVEISNEHSDDNSKGYDEVGNYRIYYDDDEGKYYYKNITNKTVSDYYDYMSFIKTKDNTYRYIQLVNYTDDNMEINYLFNIATEQTTKIEAIITNLIELGTGSNYYRNQINNLKYLIVKDDKNKYGIMDFDGNIVLNYKYDDLMYYNSDDTFIAYLNKKAGVINIDDEIIHNIEFDDIYTNDNYTVATKNNKIGIFYKDKLVVDFSINYDKSEENDTYYTEYNNDTLYLTVSPDADSNSAVYNKNTVNYIITQKGIQRTLKSKVYGIYSNNDNNPEDYVYYYNILKNEDNYDITFYDLDFYEYYKTSVPFKKGIDSEIDINRIDKTNYYEILVDYDEQAENDEYYVDLHNSKMVEEKDAIYQYFDNGYGFTLNNNILKIYKNKELLNTYDNISTYLGNYYFLNTEYSKGIYKSTIYNLTFEKESNN